MTLRDYQQAASDAAIEWVRRCIDPCVIGAPTGAGKSHIIADMARRLVEMSQGKKVLCLAPTGKLTTQNHKKYLATGNPASMFSASAGKKCTKNKVIFGTPGTVVNALHKFKEGYCAVIIDEAHGVTPTILKIVEAMRQGNPKLRIIGLSATPYRLGEGYIYKEHCRLGPVFERQESPFFHSLVYDIDARYLIAQGFLTPPVFDHDHAHYDTSGLSKNSMGRWDAKTVDSAFVGRCRLTSQIVADVVEKSKGRRGVMLFAATIQHAEEIIESLPKSLSRMVTGRNTAAENERILDAFERQEFKYLVSVEQLTTGFDAPHVDVIAILRKTESAALLTQIIGRGMRIYPNKKDFLVLDYAKNLEYHFPHGGIFEPDIKAYRKKEGGEGMEVQCPLCSGVNHFSARPNEEGFQLSPDGYFLDLAGEKILNESGIAIPSHFGRRCTNEPLIAGVHTRCSYRWSPKECPECGHENDIAARYCEKCKAEIVDPNTKLKELAAKIASDPYRVRIEPVEGIQMRRWPSKDESKPDTVRVDFHIADAPHAVSEWFSPESSSSWLLNKWVAFASKAWPGEDKRTVADAVTSKHDAVVPKEVAFRKKAGSKFYEVLSLEW